MEREEAFAILDALFFVASKPLHIDHLKRALRLGSRAETTQLVNEYVKRFNEIHKGVRISKASGRYVIHIAPPYVERVKGFIHPPPLTPGQLKTLAFIYTNQPVALADAVKVLGPRTYADIKKLSKMGLISRKRKGRTSILKVKDEAKYMILLKRKK